MRGQLLDALPPWYVLIELVVPIAHTTKFIHRNNHIMDLVTITYDHPACLWTPCDSTLPLHLNT